MEDLTAYEQTPFGWRKKRSRKMKIGLTIATAAAAAAGVWLIL